MTTQFEKSWEPPEKLHFMNTKAKTNISRRNPSQSFHYDSARARPKLGQKAAEIQPFGTIAKLPNGLSERVCRESVERLNQILADTMTLRDLYKKQSFEPMSFRSGFLPSIWWTLLR